MNKKTMSSLMSLERLPESHTQTFFIKLEMLAEVPRQPLKFNRISCHQQKQERCIGYFELKRKPGQGFRSIWLNLL